jgi:hypothetical protein
MFLLGPRSEQRVESTRPTQPDLDSGAPPTAPGKRAANAISSPADAMHARAPRVPPSPRPRVSPSPRLPVPVFPRPRIPPSPRRVRPRTPGNARSRCLGRRGWAGSPPENTKAFSQYLLWGNDVRVMEVDRSPFRRLLGGGSCHGVEIALRHPRNRTGQGAEWPFLNNAPVEDLFPFATLYTATPGGSCNAR